MKNASIIKQKAKKQPTDCKICGASALYSYFGAIVCTSCKVFFRKNAQKIKQIQFKCRFDGHCEVNISTRHVCASCRLAKCFVVGMQTELIRCSTTAKKSSTTQKFKSAVQTTQLVIMNPIQSNQTILNVDQWNLLSNLAHCYDEHSGYSIVRDYFREQNQLPLKMRFKIASVQNAFTLITNGSQFLYEKNADFISLCSHDRSFLLNNTMKYIISLSGAFVSRYAYLFDNPSLCQSIEILFGFNAYVATSRIVNFLNFDATFVKLILAILIFSTFDYVTYTNQAPKNLSNIKLILTIQDKYIELTWRYLLYKFDYKYAVISISNIVRCLFLINDTTVVAVKSQNFTNTIGSLVEQTERTLTLIK